MKDESFTTLKLCLKQSGIAGQTIKIEKILDPLQLNPILIEFPLSPYSAVEIGPESTRPELTFDLQEIRGRRAFVPTRRDFFCPKGKKIEKFDVFRGNFPNSNPNHNLLTRPEPQKIDPTRPGSKNLDPDPSLLCRSIIF